MKHIAFALATLIVLIYFNPLTANAKSNAAAFYYLDQAKREIDEKGACQPNAERNFAAINAFKTALRQWVEVLETQPEDINTMKGISATHSEMSLCYKSSDKNYLSLESAKKALDYAVIVSDLDADDPMTHRELRKLNWDVARLAHTQFEKHLMVTSFDKAINEGMLILQKPFVNADDYIQLMAIYASAAFLSDDRTEKLDKAGEAFCVLSAGRVSKIVTPELFEKYAGGVLSLAMDNLNTNSEKNTKECENYIQLDWLTDERTKLSK